MRRAGTQRRVELAAPLPDLGLTGVRVPEDEDVRAQLTIESILEGSVTATGTITAPFVGECRRCLREVEGSVDVDVQEVFEPHPVEGDTYRLDGDHVDLEPMVRDALLLALPLAPLCRDDCQGPDPDHHPVAVAEEDEDEDQPESPPADPRWSALGELRFE